MQAKQAVECPRCGGRSLVLKYEVVYEYAYLIDANAPGRLNDEEFRPYLYDNRVQKAAEQYVECASCNRRYPCYFPDGVSMLEQLRSALAP